MAKLKPLPKIKPGSPAQIRNAANKANAPVYPPIEDGNASPDGQALRTRTTGKARV
jgi:hypothetical protein